MRSAGAFIGLVICFCIWEPLLAQVPQIQKVEALNTYPANRIVISGSGFGNTPGQLQVWFDQVKGVIASSSDYAIEVDVPAQARLNSVEVVNLTSRLSAKSTLKFTPSFYGEPFDPSKFTAPLSFTSINELWDLASCDLNNDGKPEIISTKFASPATDVMILQNQSTPGNLSFTKLDKSNLPVLDLTFPSDNVTYDDLQGDGKPDLVITRSGSPRNSLVILTNTSSGSISFSSPITLLLDVGHLATRSFIKDVNDDGKPDIIVSNSFNNTLYIFQNTSSGGILTFNTTPIKVVVTGASNTYSVDIQDFDNDGLPDIMVNQFQTNDIFILKNKSAGAINFPSVQKITVLGTLNRLVSADVNNDQLLDLIVTNTIGNQVVVLINKSTDTFFSFPTSMFLSTSTGPWGVDVCDIDGDQDPDLIVANRNALTVDVFLHNGNFSSVSFSKKNINTVKPSRNILAGDLDGDGKPDIAFTSFNTSTSSYSLDILRNINCHQPEILNTQPLVICVGQTIRLNEVPALNVSFSWKEGSTPLAGTNSYLDITTPGVYTVTSVGETGACSLTSTAVTVTSDPGAPPADPSILGTTSICSGSNLQLSTPAVTNATYAWTGPNNFTSSQQNPTINNATINEAGFYTLQVTVGVCKSSVASKRVDVADLAEIVIATSVASNTICQGNSLILSITNDPSYTYKWIKDGSYIGGQTTNSLTVAQSGDYQVEVNNTNFASCLRTTGKVSVLVLTQPTAAFNVKSSGCTNELILFTNQSTTDPLATPVYSWNFDDTNTDNVLSPTHSYSAARTYSPSLNVQYSGVSGCTSSINKSIVITSSNTPTIIADPPSICPQQSSTLSISGTYTSILWSNGNTGLSTSVNSAGDYTLTALDANSCSVAAEITVSANQVPDVQVSADVQNLVPGAKAQLQASGADTYVWEPAETLSDPTISNPIASPVSTTTYTVLGSLTAGCSASKEIIITVNGSSINIKVPPAFSPNGDQSNDILDIDGILNYPNCELTIYDGRGRRIFQARGDGDKWDGNYQGRPVPEGTYYFVFACPNGKPLTGNILVFR